MRLEFLKGCVTTEGRYHEPGDIAEVPDDLAKDLIRREVAVEAMDEGDPPEG